jgi:hypothetical protein
VIGRAHRAEGAGERGSGRARERAEPNGPKGWGEGVLGFFWILFYSEFLFPFVFVFSF